MREGRLGYIVQTKRYGLLMGDLYVNQGFHCGQRMEVLEDGEWKETCLEMTPHQEWYLLNTSYKGDLENLIVRIPD